MFHLVRMLPSCVSDYQIHVFGTLAKKKILFLHLVHHINVKVLATNENVPHHYGWKRWSEIIFVDEFPDAGNGAIGQIVDVSTSTVTNLRGV